MNKNIDDELDLIYDSIDSLLFDGNFEFVDECLRIIDCEKIDTDLLLGWATITFAARSKLSHRKEFMKRMSHIIRQRGEMEDGLLNGLEE